ncbi:hypothetical protein FYJ27_10715 [Anaerosalibacter bizertensis]|uniref:Reverse transcriptase domain-containing protein n=1 Tax=Anaerosalibacter bizertensis TaxID=932217 RepID=A0A844FJA8_9FIRM|nr:RNA-directed DNA polymerase [Anaerosalibacter bizertensis]MSS44177.1 hypothetical protein [Anaerosalibacter bizertensis]
MEGNFLDINNFILAYERLKTYPRNYYKSIYINDLYNFGLNLDINIATLIDRIENDIYEPSCASKIYMPKPDGTVRSITVISFIDLLIYQAIVNILADAFYDEFKYKVNKYVFGHIYNKVTKKDEKIFFYVPWKNQWKKYNNMSIRYFEDGYKYKSEFDLASFYDTIDHTILLKFIEDKVSDEKLISVLEQQLKIWSCDPDRSRIYKNHGIPQGPNASGFLAEILLDYIDRNMIRVVKKSNTIKYIRYVDDIRLFSLNENDGRRCLAYLDLLSRDLGLIPQSSKVGIKLIKSKKELITDNKKLSQIAIYYKKNKKLKSSHNKKLTNSIKKTLTEDKINNKTYDKTIMKFVLYRIGPNDVIKEILIKHIKQFYECFDIVCYYLSKHYLNDTLVQKTIYDMLENDYTPYNYIIAIIFKYFYKIVEFDEKIYYKYYIGRERANWYIRYFMIDWIYYHSSDTLIQIPNEKNLIVRRKVEFYKYITMKDNKAKEILLKSMMEDEEVEVALLGYSLYFELFYFGIDKTNDNLNEFIKRIYDIPITDNYITIKLKEYYGITNGNEFFNFNYWDKYELNNINQVFKRAHDIIKNDSSIWLNYMNTFNHLITVKLLKLNGYKDFNVKEYSNILDNDNFMKENFPRSYEWFHEVNNRRNQLPSSHPYDKDGNIGKYLTDGEKSRHVFYFKKSVEEILIYFEGNSFKGNKVMVSV